MCVFVCLLLFFVFVCCCLSFLCVVVEGGVGEWGGGGSWKTCDHNPVSPVVVVGVLAVWEDC